MRDNLSMTGKSPALALMAASCLAVLSLVQPNLLGMSPSVKNDEFLSLKTKVSSKIAKSCLKIKALNKCNYNLTKTEKMEME